MLVPAHLRKDNSIPVITIGLDSNSDGILKKFKCSVCGGTVFGYYDHLKFVLPVDATSEVKSTGTGSELFRTSPVPLEEIQCSHRYRVDGYRVNCHAIYVIMR